MRPFRLWSLLIGLSIPASQSAAAADRAAERERMVAEIVTMAQDTGRHTGRPRFSPRVLDALRAVTRERFVPAAQRYAAYDNRPLPIGNGQTISQPYIVALSTELLDLSPDAVVLEIGTGSGYQAAVLAALVRRVYSIEIVEALGRSAAATLKAEGYDNVEVRIGDGYAGWPERAPFDAIVVTAAAPSVPEPLLAQLKPGGRMVIPVESGGFGQDLVLITKAIDGSVARKSVLPVRFVPFTGEAAKTRR
jgi:protein-L-isoaspartate(D-aspartate) O-methyltransferase